jgi:hypothetical protein
MLADRRIKLRWGLVLAFALGSVAFAAPAQSAPPAIKVTSHVNYGNVPVNTSAFENVTVTNRTDDPVFVNHACTTACAPFSQSGSLPCAPMTLAPAGSAGDSCTETWEFHPTATGRYTRTIQWTSLTTAATTVLAGNAK